MNDNDEHYGVSPRALSVARMFDRLPPGKYTVEFVRPESPTERWLVTVVQPVTIRTMDLSYKEPKKDS